MAITMYGIKNCDTIKKARVWLTENGVDFSFHDYKALGIDTATVRGWVAEHGWEVILNRAGTTFKALPDEAKAGLDADKAVALMCANPSMIKRPVLDIGDRRIVGFKPDVYAQAFS